MEKPWSIEINQSLNLEPCAMSTIHEKKLTARRVSKNSHVTGYHTNQDVQIPSLLQDIQPPHPSITWCFQNCLLVII